MIDYLERNGASPCPPEANPAEWMLKTTLPSTDGPPWFDVWQASPEYSAMKQELTQLRLMEPVTNSAASSSGNNAHDGEFIVSFSTQLREAFLRLAKHFWRSPVYIWSKLSVTILFVSLLTQKPKVWVSHSIDHGIVSFYWLQLPRQKQPSRPAESALLGLHVCPYLQPI
jgi:hypothetical protein